MKSVRKCPNCLVGADGCTCPPDSGDYARERADGGARAGLLPSAVWSVGAVRAAIRRQDAGALCRALRDHSGLTQGDLAAIAGMTQGHWSRLENGTRVITKPVKFRAFLDSLQAPEDFLREVETGARPVRLDAQLPHDPSVSIAASDAAALSLAFAEFITPSNVDDIDLEHLTRRLSRVATEYVYSPLMPLFADLTVIQEQVFTLLRGRQRPTQSRQLFFLAGVTCLLLAHASQNAGDEASALAQMGVAQKCAERADHTGLRAWAYGTDALLAEWSPQCRTALTLTQRAAALAPAGESRIRIAAIEARAAARLGDRHRAHAALDRMQQAREETPAVDEVTELGGLLTFPAAKQDYYIGSVLNLLGDYDACEHHAMRAIDHYITGPAEMRSYGDEALARVDIVTARLARGDIEAASQTFEEIAAIPPERRIRQLGAGLQRIEAMLQQPALTGRRASQQLKEIARGYELPMNGTPVRSP
ncbi:helix-turn-helix domain-containing protein [Streptomyces mobaraensis]|uniref:Helix-turn-helix domain-containing protein n=2 Tax=Streptomyces mobaraensis TaxID=35621 RepID=A0A5N5W1D6_STRMB|nr:helix-turn-helix domain-containing protein [Streptomyces mobaraensis]